MMGKVRVVGKVLARDAENAKRDRLAFLMLRSRQRQSRQSNLLFYGGLAIFLILLYGGAIFLQSVNTGGRPFGATDIAVPVLIGAFVGRKFGMGRGLLAGVILAALAQIGSRKY